VGPRTLSRRALLTRAGVAAAALGAGGLGAAARGASAAAPALPAPAASGIEHVVWVMMENRSFDHLLGWLPDADGRQAGLRYPDRAGVRHPTYHLTTTQGCDHPDPDHSYEGGRVELDGGRCDGWLRAGQNDLYAIGYYTRSDLPFLGQAALDWTACDRYFAAILAETYPNRFYQHAAVTDRLHNSTALSTLPTIWDRLAAAGVSGRYYYSDVPFLALWGAKYLPISASFPQFLADCAAGTLPSVAFVDPRFSGEDQGVSNDDHPHGSISAGETFLNQVYTAVTRGPGWDRTVLVVAFDEWGGFFEHVPPGLAPDVDPTFRRRGFRVPALIVSPFARRRAVAHGVYDHTSVLRLIEWRWSLPPLSVRDRRAANLAGALDFASPNTRAPAYAVPTVVSGPPCGAPQPSPSGPELADIAPVATAYGWPVS
jgi:phospholipase C